MAKKKIVKKKKSGMSAGAAAAIGAGVAAYSKRYKEHAPEVKALAKKLKAGWKNARNKVHRS